MRRLLFILSLSALLAPHAAAGRTNFQRQPQSASRRARRGASGIASIEAYCRSLERHFRRNARSARFFVDALPDGEPPAEGRLDWHEVKSQNEMLDAERAYANHSLVVKAKDGEIAYADFAEPREHSRRHHEYCFRPDGTLAKIVSDYYGNIAGVHVTRENFYGPDGKLLRSTDSCFSITYTSRGGRERRASCRRAEMRQELPDESLPVYKRNADLPGYETLRR
ncbi:MAG TPA: hypothetical protein VGC87_05210 [Pyrinomonadaceae bacterium]|jgi:hypothetical protein